VENPILVEIKEATSILLDSTPDLSYPDQMSFFLRYVKVDESEAQIKESAFLPTARGNGRINY